MKDYRAQSKAGCNYQRYVVSAVLAFAYSTQRWACGFTAAVATASISDILFAYIQLETLMIDQTILIHDTYIPIKVREHGLEDVIDLLRAMTVRRL